MMDDLADLADLADLDPEAASYIRLLYKLAHTAHDIAVLLVLAGIPAPTAQPNERHDQCNL